MKDMKRILIVDDSEIDREVLKSILENEFELIEADNGYSALDILLKEKSVDAVLLDISMPYLDGLSVLRILREDNSYDVPVFMITAEATKDNVEKALQYNITEFIKKPFDREDILNRVRTKLGISPEMYFSMTEIDDIKNYMADLERLYNRYLFLSGQDKMGDERRADVMEILLKQYSSMENGEKLDNFQIEMLSKAAYLCNIGMMLLPDILDMENPEGYTYQQHPGLGADIIQLNRSKHCEKFIRIGTDICMHHHERYDGNGFPQGISGCNISIYAQICGLLEQFDKLFFWNGSHNEQQFHFVMKQLKSDTGLVSEEVYSLMEESKAEIIKYYDSVFGK